MGVRMTFHEPGTTGLDRIINSVSGGAERVRAFGTDRALGNVGLSRQNSPLPRTMTGSELADAWAAYRRETGLNAGEAVEPFFALIKLQGRKAA
jgi:hypothetical protein